MRKRLVPLISALLLALALAGPAAAHELEVVNPKTGKVVLSHHWIGGFTLPEAAWDAPPVFGPFHLPPSHAHGLPMACMSTTSSRAVTITAPPFFTGCEHGQP